MVQISIIDQANEIVELVTEKVQFLDSKSKLDLFNEVADKVLGRDYKLIAAMEFDLLQKELELKEKYLRNEMTKQIKRYKMLRDLSSSPIDEKWYTDQIDILKEKMGIYLPNYETLDTWDEVINNE